MTDSNENPYGSGGGRGRRKAREGVENDCQVTYF